jgi:hypothetical protein
VILYGLPTPTAGEAEPVGNVIVARGLVRLELADADAIIGVYFTPAGARSLAEALNLGAAGEGEPTETSPLDYCGSCGRRITDTDDNGTEDSTGQRWCLDHRPPPKAAQGGHVGAWRPGEPFTAPTPPPSDTARQSPPPAPADASRCLWCGFTVARCDELRSGEPFRVCCPDCEHPGTEPEWERPDPDPAGQWRTTP